MNFTRLTLEDIDDIRPLMAKAANRLCDNTIGTLFMWRDYFKTHYFIDENGSLYGTSSGKVLFYDTHRRRY